MKAHYLVMGSVGLLQIPLGTKNKENGKREIRKIKMRKQNKEERNGQNERTATRRI